MTSRIKLTAKDGHEFAVTHAYAAQAIGSVIILHAVYGITDHISKLCNRFATAGFSSFAPWLFDRVQADLVHPYTPDGTKSGSESYKSISEDKLLMDIDACREEANKYGNVAICGFCTGGTWAWVGASALDFDAAVVFYGSQVIEHIHRSPNCPTEMHYGDEDFVVPINIVEMIRTKHFDVPCHIYEGCNHAFFNPEQKFYNAKAADLMWDRSLNFLRDQLSKSKSMGEPRDL